MESRQRIDIKPFIWPHPEKTYKSKCDIELYRRGQGAVVIATERGDDIAPGMSITNGSEHIATYLMQQQDLDPQFVIWIEHYCKGGRAGRRQETWDLVQFNYDSSAHRFYNPRWVRIDDSAVEALINT